MMFKLKPAFKDYLWGGTKLKTDFGFESELDKLAEGWMLSCHKDGESIVDSGEFKGKTLSEYIGIKGKSVLGSNAEGYDFFPILIKLIDAKDNLSVQVHPDNEYALRVEGEYGKTECWYILDCDEGAELIYGFKKKIDADEFKRRIADGSFLEVVNRVKVKKGDFFFIEAGTLHAIGKGILLCEIQQNSNTTYRVYDYDRVDKYGNRRPLHTEKAIDVTVCDRPKYGTQPAEPPVPFGSGTSQLLTECRLFRVERLTVDTSAEIIPDSSSFISLIITDGEGEITDGSETLKIKKGDSIFVEAGSPKITLTGKADIIKTNV
ncbi:MAG: class I mannose-6-phosphate isomerase [Clostridia bacterium]|nr:class I mannose-6-phosphate isomerase [Clostridia bacterium]